MPTLPPSTVPDGQSTSKEAVSRGFDRVDLLLCQCYFQRRRCLCHLNFNPLQPDSIPTRSSAMTAGKASGTGQVSQG